MIKPVLIGKITLKAPIVLQLCFSHVEIVRLQHGKNNHYVNSATIYVNINQKKNENNIHQ